ncbi:NERD domain-containing protein [Oscillochloris sp. ZM17-4]|uniref:nuclease-related domain-containing protein n=1 Tax=Oscillochloris sp. ZM17-4 TaxID=2866714 RepID=UPI001C73CE5F|nr:nuclease-related domain-containing protein [Oscillochloris sp. ZM17-4]MBX0328144.1 NERD domain-containing protein [Oscillochloris sp. ZM17-4]
MAVQVWIGEKPEHPNERRAIMALANGLDRLDGLHLILANFSVGGRTVDMVIIKHDAIFIVELKHCDGRVIGSVNGPWFVEGRNGERKRLNPGRKNPYNQVISYFHALTNFLNEHRREFLSQQKANDIDFRTCKRAVVISPTMQEGSEIELDWKVELKGLDELPAYLITERSSEIELTDDEMLAIPQMLHCTPWDEINTVIRGVISEPDAPPPAPAPPIEVAPQDESPPGLWQRIVGILRTTTGRVAAGLALMVAVLFIALIMRPAQVIIPDADQPLVPIAEVTGVPTGGAPLADDAPDGGCRWSSYQLVGKRWDGASGGWVSVAVGEGSAGLLPEVVVALEQVATCSDQITLTWSVQNNSAKEISFPLRSDNIQISDSLGNDYQITDDASQPNNMRVAPGAKERGVSVSDRPVSRSASSLLVRLKNQPFGEASFVVSLQK